MFLTTPTVLRVCALHACGHVHSLAVRVCVCTSVCVCALCACVHTGAHARARGSVIATAGGHPHLLESPAGRARAIFGHCVGALLAGDYAGSHCENLGGRVQAAHARIDAVVQGPGDV